MRIAFDLDDTLVRCGHDFAVEPPRLPLLAWLGAVPRLRAGTLALLRELESLGCDIWVYTSSHRGAASIRLLFLAHGVFLGGVVNARRHERRMRERGMPVGTKYPPAFGIDVLVDDSVAVQQRGQREGFRVIRVDPLDPRWAEGVIRAVRRLRGAERRRRDADHAESET